MRPLLSSSRSSPSLRASGLRVVRIIVIIIVIVESHKPEASGCVDGSAVGELSRGRWTVVVVVVFAIVGEDVPSWPEADALAAKHAGQSHQQAEQVRPTRLTETRGRRRQLGGSPTHSLNLACGAGIHSRASTTD